MRTSRRPTRNALLSGIVACFFFTACDGSSTGPAEGEIGEEGGTATLANGAVVISVPTGALDSRITFTATPSSGGPADDKLVAGSSYDIGPSGTTFQQPATVTIVYDPGSIPDGIVEGELGLYKAVGSSWELQEDAGVSTLSHSVFGKTDGLSLFAARALDVATVDVSPTSAELDVGGSAQFTATTRSEDGTELIRDVSWESSVPSVATVDEDGSVTAVAEGTTTITATSEGQSGTATVTVTIPVASVEVTPGAGTINAGETIQLTGTPKDASGNTLARTVTWSSSNDAVATSDGDGLVTGLSEGTATITAMSEGVTGTATITVNDPVTTVQVSPAASTLELNETVQLSATALGATGNVLAKAVTWSTSDGAVATVSATGMVTATGGGTATITATADGVDGTATVTVTVPVASVDVTPAASTINVLETVQLTATPRDANGNALTTTVTWTSSDDAVATVDTNGLVTGQGEGTATITATAEDASTAVAFGGAGAGGPSRTASGDAAVTVNDPVSSVEVTPSQSSLTAGAAVQLTATAKGAKGNEISGKTATWTSSDDNKATVDGNGLVTAVAGGTVTITATIDGVQGTAQITVILNIPDLAGNWAGQWVNTTFNSTGTVTMTIVVDEANHTVQFTIDVNGPAFGGGDPPPATYNGTYADGVMTITGTNANFGDLNLTWSANGVNGTLTNLPAGSGINSVTLAGTGSATQLNLTYDIDATWGTATGTFTINHQ